MEENQNSDEYEVNEILEKRSKKRKGKKRKVTEYLVSWKGYES